MYILRQYSVLKITLQINLLSKINNNKIKLNFIFINNFYAKSTD